MPRRKLRTYGCGVSGVTPGSDVTQEMMSLANAGTTVAAALGRAVPCFGRHGDSKAVVGESGASSSERKLGEATARQWPFRWRAYGWCRALCHDESADGQYVGAAKTTCRRPILGRRSVKGGKRLKERRSEERLSFGGELTADGRGVPCTRGFPLLVFGRVAVWIDGGDKRNVVTHIEGALRSTAASPNVCPASTELCRKTVPLIFLHGAIPDRAILDFRHPRKRISGARSY